MPTKSVTALAFIFLASSATASWLENDQNPVFSPPGGAAWPVVLHDSAAFPGAGPTARWKLWFTQGDGATALLGHATSNDGRTWTQQLIDPDFPAGLVAPRVVHDPNRFGEGANGPLYKMWVSDRTGAVASIRLLESDDGLTWTDNGIVIDGASEWEHLWNMAVVYQPAAGGSSVLDSRYLGFLSKGSSVTLFTSADGAVWAQQQVLTVEASHAAPLVLPDGSVRMFASVTEFSNLGAPDLRVDQFLLLPLPGGSGYDVRLASEGMAGVGQLGAPGTWNESAQLAPAVAFDGSSVHVFRMGLDDGGQPTVGLAITQPWSFGDTWEPAQGARNPEILTDGSSFTGFGPTVRYKMWHSNGSETAILHAGSVDGDKWTQIGGALTGLAANATDIEIVHDPLGFGSAPMDHAYRAIYRDPNAPAGIERFRSAKSMDGLVWFDDQPLQQAGSSVVSGAGLAWNAFPGQPVELIHDPDAPATLDLADPWNNRFVLVYSASDGNNASWGLAMSSDGITFQGWQDGAAPILSPGNPGEWDEGNLAGGTVVPRPDGSFDAWFSAENGGSDRGIGHASSSDGLTWTTCVNNPILALGGCGPQGGLGCGDLAENGNGAPTAVLEEVTDGGCTPISQYRIWRGGLDSLGASAVASASTAVDFPASGAVLRVPEDFSSIQAAITAADPGDTVLVAGGVYNENVVIDRPLQLIGAARDTTVIRSADSTVPQQAVIWVRGTDGTVSDCVRISNLTVDGMKGDPARQVNAGVRTGDLDLASMTDEAGWAPRNTDVTIRDCRIENARTTGVLVHAAFSPQIEGCLISGLGDGFLPQSEPYVGVRILASKLPVVTGNSIDLDLDPAGLTDVGGIRLDPVGSLLWEGFQVSDNSVVGPNVGGGIVVLGDRDSDPANHAVPEGRLISGNLVDGQGVGTEGLVLRGGVYGTTVRGNELRANGVNLWLSEAGTASLPMLIEDNLMQGVHVLPGDHGIYLDDVNRDGLDQVHLVLTGNTIRNHSGSGIYAVSKNINSTVVLGDAGAPAMGNSLFDNCRFNVELTREAHNPMDLPNNLQVDAQNNYWGVDCGPGVQSTIFDRFNVQSVGLATVFVSPWTDDKFETLDNPMSCAGEFSPKTLTLTASDLGASRELSPIFSYDVIAGEMEVGAWIIQFPDEMVFTGFPAGEAGSWSFSGLINGSFPLIGVSPESAFFDVDLDGNFGMNDYIVTWAGNELVMVLGQGSGSGVEQYSLTHEVQLDSGLFVNPPEPGSYVIESRWRSRDGRLECMSFVENVVCTLPGSAHVGTVRVRKDPAGVRAWWPAIDTSGLDCFSGYALIGGDDPSDLRSFADRSALDVDPVPTNWIGDLGDTYFLVVAVGPDGQFGPVAPNVFIP